MCLPLGLTDSHIMGSALGAEGFPGQILRLLTPEVESMDPGQGSLHGGPEKLELGVWALS